MRLSHLVIKELIYQRLNAGLSLLSVAAAIASLVVASAFLRVHDLRTEGIVSRMESEIEKAGKAHEEEMRKAMLHLGFNVLIVPRELEIERLYLNDLNRFMPESHVDKLSRSKIVTIQHIMPSLHQKVTWPETKRTVIVIGTQGEVAVGEPAPKKPLQEPVKPGQIVLGHELSESLSLKTGGKTTVLGREFVVQSVHRARGNQDDVTMWMPLRDAQSLLGKEGLINAIFALECRCAWTDIAKVRAEIEGLLPGTKVIEQTTKALARAEARLAAEARAKEDLERVKRNRAELRTSRERLVAMLLPAIMIGCGLWIGVLMFLNVLSRRVEIGILRALGLRPSSVLGIFLLKAVVMGLVGAVLGLALGWALAIGVSGLGAADGLRQLVWADREALWLIVCAPIIATALTLLASWIPALFAARLDPAVILREA
ncbi:MAG: FtsX-like permease family protein [Planctomycetes bacterium]|nr:FtsX-like permease family protein [Planctomycetota bacterium]